MDFLVHSVWADLLGQENADFVSHWARLRGGKLDLLASCLVGNCCAMLGQKTFLKISASEKVGRPVFAVQ